MQSWLGADGFSYPIEPQGQQERHTFRFKRETESVRGGVAGG